MNKQDSIGALWAKQGKGGQYLSGYVEVDGKKLNIVAFTNQYKKESKHPDYRILESKPQEQRADSQEELNKEAAQDGGLPQDEAERAAEDEDLSNVPF